MESGPKSSLIPKGCPGDLKADTGVPQSRTWTAALAQAGFEDREVPSRKVGAWVASQHFGVASHSSPTSTIILCHEASWFPKAQRRDFPPGLCSGLVAQCSWLSGGRCCAGSLCLTSLSPQTGTERPRPSWPSSPGGHWHGWLQKACSAPHSSCQDTCCGCGIS